MSSPFALLVLSTLPWARAADYTGDGIDDLVVGVPFEGIGTVLAPGGVEVIRGSASGLPSARGLTAFGDALLDQDTAGVPSTNDAYEWFGYAIAAGDIDGDGRDDLVVGGTYAVVRGVAAGAVWRLELAASRDMLSVTTAQLFTQDTAGVSGTAESDDWYGGALAVADFNGDGYDDVVAGIPGEDVGTIAQAGGISFLPGGPTGLTATGQLYYDQNVTDVNGTAETGDQFGYALAAGDFDDDGYADLAIGSPDEDWSGIDEGSVQVMYGTSTGPGVVSPDDQLWSAGSSSSVAGTLQDSNHCGWALAVGDFDGDAYDDLAIGCYGYDVGSATGAGAVLAVYGSASGLDASELWSQDSSGVVGTPEDSDYFGTAVTSGDYDGDGYDDLAVGVMMEDYGAYTDNGVVHVLPGSSGGLTDVGSLLLAQDSGSTVAGTPADSDFFGYSLASGNWNDDRYDDLAVGSPGDDEGGATDAGVANVFYGGVSGPSSGDRIFHQDTTGIEDVSEAGDWFGFSLQ